MIENDNADFQIIMNMLVKQREKEYLIIIASNTSRDFAIILVQESSNVYCSKYVLDDFRKINFFKKYLGNLRQCIETMINLLKQKKHLINIEEEENIQVKLSLDIEISVVDININLPKERIEFILENDNVDQKIKNNIIWHSVLYLFQEKEEDQKIRKGLENKINQLNKEINDLKGSLEGQKLLSYIRENRNDLIKSKIINVHNKKSFELVERRLRIINNNNNKEIIFTLLYSAKINGDKSQKFHELCDNHRNTLVIIETQSDNIFGGFAGKTWNSMELGRKRDLRSFLFSLKNSRIYDPKKDSKYHLFCSDNEGPCFYAFSIDNQCLENGGFCDEINKCSYDSFEYDFELNNGEKQFKVKELEVYEVKFI